ncbi:hypothetical protein B0H12DRAFT_1230605 [Mycena haematopus]|nr:hypothetical protein B0H12DRAFT_1230605 [Mycena haematopus]
MPWSLLRSNSREEWQSEAECRQIKAAFAARDRAKITSFAQFRTCVVFLDGGLACSRAIAARRTAIRDPGRFRHWMEARLPPPAPPSPVPPPGEGGEWGDADWNSGWGEDGMASAWDSQERWDGPHVPKSKGKRKRQRQRKAAQRAKVAAQIEARWREALAEWDRWDRLRDTSGSC